MTAFRLRRIALPLGLFLTVAVGLPLAAPTLNGVKLAGLPLGFWVAAQASPLLLAVAMIWLASRKSRP